MRLRRSAKRAARRAGFSLIEIMVAMLLLALTVTGLTAYTGYVADARLASKYRALALIAAQEAIDVVRSTPFDNVSAGTQSVVSTVGNIPLTVKTEVTLTRPTLKLVAITVTSASGAQLQYFVTAVFRGKV